MLAPDLAELVFGEPHGGAEVALSQGPLVAELDELAHDRVQIGIDPSAAVAARSAGMLEGPRRDVRQPVALGGIVGPE